MDSVSFDFFTPIDYGDQPKTVGQSILETVDHYFYLGGRKARVIPSELVNGSQSVEIVESEQSLLITCLKVASYFTLLMAVLFTLKLIARGFSNFHVVKKPEPDTPKAEEKLKDDKPSTTPFACAESYYANGDLVKALLSAAQVVDSELQAGLLSRILKEMKHLALNDDGTLVIGSIEQGSKAIEVIDNDTIKDLYYTIIAEHYYARGELVKALLTINMLKDEDLLKNLLTKVHEDKKPLALKEDGSLVIGSIEEASKAIETVSLEVIKNVYYFIITEHYTALGELVKALKAMRNNGSIFRLYRDKKLLVQNEDGTWALNLERSAYTPSKDVIYAMMAIEALETGRQEDAADAIGQIKDSIIKKQLKELRST